MNFPIFKNDRKTNDSQPDYQSKFEVKEAITLVPGKKYKFSGWIKPGNKGKYISGKITEDTYQGGNQTPQSSDTIGDEDIPF